MAYVRKTRDIWVVQQKWDLGWEDVGEYNNHDEARVDKKAYLENQPGIPCRIVMRREKIKEA